MARLRRISATAVETYQRCREEYRFAYAIGARPPDRDRALEFGSALHKGLEVWWPAPDPEAAVAAALAYADGTELDAYDRVKLEVLLLGYHARWAPEHAAFEVEGVEEWFNLAGHGYALVGALDVRAKRRGLPILVEHKSTSQDVAPGSLYWRTLAIDTQVGLYLDAAQRLHGREANTVLYDVVRKPDCEPKLATPPEARKYTKGKPATKTKPAEPPRLYAGQREHDETPAEYRARLIADVSKRPERYFARQDVVRLGHEIERIREDVHTLAMEMAAVDADRPQPRSIKACRRYGRTCPYLGVCTGVQRLDDANRFRLPGSPKQETA